MDFTDRHVVITGASSGIGRELALALLAEGAFITSLERSKLEPPEERWQSFQADITSGAAVEKAFTKMKRPIDVLVNNAGVMARNTLLDSSEEEYDLLMDTHVKGSWLVLKYALPHLQDGAAVVQMSSRHGLSLPKTPAWYGLSKRIVIDMMEVFAKTYPQYRVKILCPGPVDTPLTRTGASAKDLRAKKKIMCTPKDIVEQLLLLLRSDTKSRLIFDDRTATYFFE